MLFFLSMMCGLFSLVGLFCELIYMVSKTKKITLISLVRLGYLFIYGILPCIVFYLQSTGKKVQDLVINQQNTLNSYLFFLFAIIGYFLLSVGYNVSFGHSKIKAFPQQKETKTLNIKICEKTDFSIILASTIFLVFGWSALYLWTRVYGGFYNFMQNAAIIRSGYGIYNPYAFCKHFAKLLNITTPIFIVSFFVALAEHRKYKFTLLLLSIVSLIGSIIFLLCSDSRTDVFLLIVFVILPIVEYHNRGKNNIGHQLIFLGCFIAVVFMITSISSQILDQIRYEGNMTISNENSIIDTLVNEFYTWIRSQQFAVSYVFSENYHSLLLNDILNTIFAWIPSSMQFISVPPTVWATNTLLTTGSTTHATMPTDLLTTSLYLFGLVGPIFITFIAGLMTKKLEQIIDRICDEKYLIIIKYVVGMKLLNSVMYYQLSSIFYENTYLFIVLPVIALLIKNTRGVHSQVK